MLIILDKLNLPKVSSSMYEQLFMKEIYGAYNLALTCKHTCFMIFCSAPIGVKMLYPSKILINSSSMTIINVVH